MADRINMINMRWRQDPKGPTKTVLARTLRRLILIPSQYNAIPDSVVESCFRASVASPCVAPNHLELCKADLNTECENITTDLVIATVGQQYPGPVK